MAVNLSNRYFSVGEVWYGKCYYQDTWNFLSMDASYDTGEHVEVSFMLHDKWDLDVSLAVHQQDTMFEVPLKGVPWLLI